MIQQYKGCANIRTQDSNSRYSTVGMSAGALGPCREVAGHPGHRTLVPVPRKGSTQEVGRNDEIHRHADVRCLGCKKRIKNIVPHQPPEWSPFVRIPATEHDSVLPCVYLFSSLQLQSDGVPVAAVTNTTRTPELVILSPR